MLLGPDHMADRQIVVVNNGRQMVEAASVGPLDHVVLLSLPGKLHPPANSILDHEHPLAGHLQPHHPCPALRLIPLGRGLIKRRKPSAVEKRLPSGLRGSPLLIQLGRRRIIAVGMAAREQLLHGRGIPVASLRLVVGSIRPAHARPLVPVDPQPPQPIENRLERLVDVASDVSVVDPQDELPAVLPGEKPVEQRRANPADMQVAGGTGGEAGANSHAEGPRRNPVNRSGARRTYDVAGRAVKASSGCGRSG